MWLILEHPFVKVSNQLSVDSEKFVLTGLVLLAIG